MSDLVERLREMGRYPRTHFHYQDGADIVVEAAAEVERLRTALAEQARLNGIGSEREAEAYRRGVEEAARGAECVADNCALHLDTHGRNVARECAEAARVLIDDEPAAIRSLTSKHGEEE